MGAVALMTGHGEPVPALPRLHSVAEVARALRSTERYVSEQARLWRWPHVRMARGAAYFTDDDVRAIVELHHEAVRPVAGRELSWAPRSAGAHNLRGGG